MTDNPIFAGPRHRIRRWHNYGMSMGFGIRFLPTDIAGLQLWLDFSDISTLFIDSAKTTSVTSDGDVIGAAEDKSGNGNDILQATTANKPLYKTTIQNGLSIGRFDGVNDFVATIAFGSTLTQPNTIIHVGNKKNAQGDNAYFYDGIDGANRNASLTNVGRTPDGLRIFAGASFLPDTTHPLNVMILQTALFSGLTSEIWLNGVTQGVGNASIQGINGLTVGAVNGGGGSHLDGDMAEILVYNANLSSADRQAVEIYLNNKWAIY